MYGCRAIRRYATRRRRLCNYMDGMVKVETLSRPRHVFFALRRPSCACGPNLAYSFLIASEPCIAVPTQRRGYDDRSARLCFARPQANAAACIPSCADPCVNMAPRNGRGLSNLWAALSRAVKYWLPSPKLGRICLHGVSTHWTNDSGRIRVCMNSNLKSGLEGHTDSCLGTAASNLHSLLPNCPTNTIT